MEVLGAVLSFLVPGACTHSQFWYHGALPRILLSPLLSLSGGLVYTWASGCSTSSPSKQAFLPWEKRLLILWCPPQNTDFILTCDHFLACIYWLATLRGEGFVLFMFVSLVCSLEPGISGCPYTVMHLLKINIFVATRLCFLHIKICI